jgi:hypothetical protein
MTTYLIPLLGLLLLGGIVYWVYRKNGQPGQERQRFRAQTAQRYAGNAGSLWRRFGAWLRRLTEWFRIWQERKLGLNGPVPAPAGPAADPVRLRSVPSVRDDPALGAPVPVEQITASPVAPDVAAAAARIAAYEPETDADLAAFMRGEAAGLVALAGAWHSFAENCTTGVGLDPAFAAGLVELGDTVGDSAHDVILAYRRFAVIYQQILEAVASGTLLPHNARQFLTAEGL